MTYEWASEIADANDEIDGGLIRIDYGVEPHTVVFHYETTTA